MIRSGGAHNKTSPWVFLILFLVIIYFVEMHSQNHHEELNAKRGRTAQPRTGTFKRAYRAVRTLEPGLIRGAHGGYFKHPAYTVLRSSEAPDAGSGDAAPVRNTPKDAGNDADDPGVQNVVNVVSDALWNTTGDIIATTVLRGGHGRWCDAIGSFMLSGYAVSVLGWGEPPQNNALEAVLNAAQSVSGHQYILMFDATVAVSQRPEGDLLAEAMKQLTNGVEAVFAASVDCTVHSLERSGCGHEAFPKAADGTLRYLNGRMWIARASFIREFFSFLLREVVPALPQDASTLTDTSVIGKGFTVDRFRNRMAIDVNNTLFQSVRLSEQKLCASPLYGGTLQNCATKSVSSVVQFTSTGRGAISKWRDGFWWPRHVAELSCDAAVFVNYERRQLSEVCPGQPCASK